VLVACGLLIVGATGIAAAQSTSRVTMEKVTYKGWPDCVRVTNGQIELIVPTVIGLRVTRFGFVGDENEFREMPGQIGKTGGNSWRIYGGHRLWHAPEANPRTYEPDNEPIQATFTNGTLFLTQPVEKTTGIQKQMELTMDAEGAHVRVLHRLKNRGLWPVTLAPWSLSAMAQGGRAVIPQARRMLGSNLLPNRALILWPYTDMSDPRALWGRRFVMVTQNPKNGAAFKIGVTGIDGWAGYVRGGHLFLKRFTHQLDALYPDFGASVEAYTNADFLELETVGPLRELQPGQFVEHVEDWYLFRDADATDEATVQRTILPHVEATNTRPQ
jgi:hypothetical protein